MITDKEFFTLVLNMRKAQKAYYKHPGVILHSADKRLLLEQSKELEREVDKVLDARYGEQQTLI